LTQPPLFTTASIYFCPYIFTPHFHFSITIPPHNTDFIPYCASPYHSEIVLSSEPGKVS
jgi:hypothetical protein